MASPTQFKVYYRNNLGSQSSPMIAQFRAKQDADLYLASLARRVVANARLDDEYHFAKVTEGYSGPTLVSFRFKSADREIQFKRRGQEKRIYNTAAGQILVGAPRVKINA